MDTLDQIEIERGDNIITEKALSNMRGTSPWMVVLGVLFLIIAFFMLIGGMGILISAGQFSSIKMTGAMQLMGGFYLISGGLVGAGGVLSIISGTKLSSFSRYPQANILESFTAKQKLFWMIMGINIIVSVVFFAVFIAMAGRLATMAGSL